jgi:hypothetical protein
MGKKYPHNLRRIVRPFSENLDGQSRPSALSPQGRAFKSDATDQNGVYSDFDDYQTQYSPTGSTPGRKACATRVASNWPTSMTLTVT